MTHPGTSHATGRQGPPCAIFAHRGNSSQAPENTMAAFHSAVQAGADGVELDVWLSADGVPVVHHDAKLGRTCNGKGPLVGHTWRDLSALDAGGWFGESFRGEGIPRLEQVLELLGGSGLRLNIELKAEGHAQPALVPTVLEAVRGGWKGAPVIISSFHHACLPEARTLAQRMDLPVELAPIISDGLLAPWDYALLHGFNALHPGHWELDAGYVSFCHRQGVALRPYTVDDPIRATQLMDWDVQAIITNRPAEMLAIRAERAS